MQQDFANPAHMIETLYYKLSVIYKVLYSCYKHAHNRNITAYNNYVVVLAYNWCCFKGVADCHLQVKKTF